jgi:transposase-like protein
MVQVKDLTELKIEVLWREGKGDDEDWWGDLKQETLRMVRRLLESAMEEELLECLPVGRYRRTELRRRYRNGYRRRNLLKRNGQCLDYM